MKTFALVGRNISYSFSRRYFAEKFAHEQITDSEYVNFDIPTIEELPALIRTTPTLVGMNVTIPYKEAILPLLDEQSEELMTIKACNTIKVLPTGKLKGYNTDYIGFHDSLVLYLKPHHNKALILGTGGASKAVIFTLEQLGIPYILVSRKASAQAISYASLGEEIIRSHLLIINTTPLGTSPDTQAFPPIPYEFVTDKHLLYDLIYNPEKTVFLAKGEAQGATILNGYPMLALQAEASWEIWNSEK
ncbi:MULTISPECIES: shikimate dehydrogenase family protein [unclassified Capnocytophaga]|jgi:shikimate dehydrogenase|uniref:shikimate dehydrogenase family protein n=1 Tax=unclassified Capnocytophaga TaxID=2640652 RepID=UPI000202CC0B|nr:MULTISPECIES: shikimate dehydrogenase [unclassified Capnocytophaga]EGD33540.1 shikimate dehydrogenase [Capnocytophaga sp. oral taxon 338 str. F0234]MEB3004164.1 shikimate dehydrogenase [Capnocytophaga sp. G2]